MCDVTARPSETETPRWRRLYALLPLSVLLFGAADALSRTIGWRTLPECLAALVVFGTMAAWVRSNRVALDQVGWCACAGAKMTVHVVHSESWMPYSVEPTHPPVPSRDGEEEESEECLVISGPR